MMLSFGITTIVASILGLIGGIRLNICLVLVFAIYGSILTLVVMVLAVNQLKLVPIVVLVMVTTGSGFLYSNALRNIVIIEEDNKRKDNSLAFHLNVV